MDGTEYLRLYFFFKIKLSIFFLFASLGLCCSMQVFSSCGSWVLQFLCGFLVLLQHVGSQFPNQQSNSYPALEDGFLTTGPLEKSPGLLLWVFFNNFIYLFLFWLCQVVVVVQALLQLWPTGATLQMQCTVFSCCGAQALGHMDFRHWGFQALEHSPNSCGAGAQLFLEVCGIFLNQGSSLSPCIGWRVLYH